MDGVERKEIDLEDFHEDILGKAMRGLTVGKGEMASRLKVCKSEVEAVLSGALNEILIAGMAEELGLGKSKLLVSARKEWSPAPLEMSPQAVQSPLWLNVCKCVYCGVRNGKSLGF